MRILAICTSLVLGLNIFSVANAALLSGHTMTLQNLFPDQDTSLASPVDGDYIVGDGVEIPDYLSGLVSIDISDSEILVSYNGGGLLSLTVADFNGFSLTDSFGTIADFVSLSIIEDTTVDGQAEVSFLADTLFINIAGVKFAPGGFIRFAINGAASEVPLPAALPLFLAGLAGLGFTGRKRKAIAA